MIHIKPVRRLVLASLLVVSALLAMPAIAQSRTSAECLNEQLTQEALERELSRYFYDGGKPPGQMIMIGPFGDPKFQDLDWEKWEWTMYFRETKSSDPGYVQRFTVQMHYMVNLRTRQIDQVKFKTTPSQGCVGERRVAEASDPGTEFDATNPPSGWYWGSAVTFLGTTLRTPVVEVRQVGPIIPVYNNVFQTAPAPGGGGCGSGKEPTCPILLGVPLPGASQ